MTNSPISITMVEGKVKKLIRRRLLHTMKIKLEIIDRNNLVKAAQIAENEVTMMWNGAYEEGDHIVVTAEKECDLVMYLDETLGHTLVHYKAPYCLNIPFVEQRTSYSLRAFADGRKCYRVRLADPRESENYRNLCYNPYDYHENTGIYPHSKANVETRGEAVFASRNAMDGIIVNNSHGWFPYASWGINRNPDAEMYIDFGRDVTIDKVVFYNRADFPHDAWWTEGTIAFSDGSEETFSFVKTGEAQIFPIKERTIRTLTIKNLIKKEDDPSPFPALTQIEIWGRDAR